MQACFTRDFGAGERGGGGGGDLRGGEGFGEEGLEARFDSCGEGELAKVRR